MNFLQRWLRRLTWTLATLVTLCLLLCAWVNWSGARQWRAVQAVLKAEGETLDFRATANEPLPESENFCAIPLLKDIALVVDGDWKKGGPGEKRERLATLKLPSKTKNGDRPSFTNAALGQRADLRAWADWLRKEGSLKMPADSGDAARDVLAALSKDDAIVQELAAGLNCTKAQWTPEWKTCELPALLSAIPLPHLTAARGVTQTLTLRAVAAARTGDAAKAHESALIIARLCQASLNDPFLIGLAVASSDAASLHGTVWELCAIQAGTVEDFTRLESEIKKLDFHRAALHAWRSEMASLVGTMQQLKNRRGQGIAAFSPFSNDGSGQSRTERLFMRGLPAGFFDSSSAVLAELEFRHIIKPLKETGWQRALSSAQDLENEMSAMKQKVWTHPSYIFPAIVIMPSERVIARSAYANALVNQAMIACALERHRIEKGSYPDSLDGVRLADGRPLPPDPMGGKPMRYRKTADGKYALWSIGFDGKDDGGKRTLDGKKPEETRFHDATYVGDWVWDFPAE